MIGQYSDRKPSGRERGAGSRKVCELGLELRTSEAKWRYMTLPMRLLAPTKVLFFKLQITLATYKFEHTFVSECLSIKFATLLF